MDHRSAVSRLTAVLREVDVQEEHWWENRLAAAHCLEAIVARDVPASDRAWAVLVEGLFDDDRWISRACSRAIARRAKRGGDHRELALGVFEVALDATDVNLRTRTIEGLRTVAEDDPDAASRVAPLLGRALEERSRELAERHDDVDGVEDLGGERLRRFESTLSASAGLLEAGRADPEAIRAVLDRRRLPDFVEEQHREMS